MSFEALLFNRQEIAAVERLLHQETLLKRVFFVQRYEGELRAKRAQLKINVREHNQAFRGANVTVESLEVAS